MASRTPSSIQRIITPSIFLAFLLNQVTIGLYAQNPPQQRPWIDAWRDATVAIGTPKKTLPKDSTEKETEYFHVLGTGVVFRIPGSPYPWLISAKHVLVNPNLPDPKLIRIRFAWFEDRRIDEYLGVAVPLFGPDGKDLRVVHPTADLAAIPLVISQEDAGRKDSIGVAESDFANEDETYVGASTMILGYPGAIERQFWTKAIARAGIISWLSSKDPKAPILIDGTVTYGHSGGPAFRTPLATDKFGNFVPTRTAFLGIVSQLRYQKMFALVNDEQFPITAPNGQQVMFPSLMAIGVLEPAANVKELLRLVQEYLKSK